MSQNRCGLAEAWPWLIPGLLMLAGCGLNSKLYAETPMTLGEPAKIEVAAIPSVEQIIREEAKRNGVPEQFALAEAIEESGLDPTRRGKLGEIGLFQLRCGYDSSGRARTAQMLGFRGRCRELYDARTNAYWGTLHLALALMRTRGDLDKAATLHNEGLGAVPRKSRYSKKVMRLMQEGLTSAEELRKVALQ